MKNKILTLLLLSMVTLTACNTKGNVTDVQGDEAIDTYAPVTVGENDTAPAVLDTPLVVQEKESNKSDQNYTIVYETESVMIAMPTEEMGKEEVTMNTILSWGIIDGIDMAHDIIMQIYSRYGCGIKGQSEYYEADGAFVTTYELVNGSFMDCVKFEDGSLILRDVDTSEDIWDSVTYLETEVSN